MFTGFSKDAVEVVNRAEQHAAELDSDHVGAEHILLGLLSQQSGLGGQVLRTLGFSDQSVRQRVNASNGAARDDAGDLPSPGRFERLGHPLIERKFTPRAQSVLEYAVREALVLGSGAIGSEHILLGLSRQDGSLAMAVLKEIDTELPRDQERFDRNHLGLEFRNAVIRALTEATDGNNTVS